MLPVARAVRYVTPLKEGGSLPGVVEADDLGTWVMKFVGAGQGRKVLVAEVIVGEIARAVGLHVPVLKAIELPEQIAKYEADEEVQDLLTASVGTNLGVDLLPGAFGYDGSTPPSAEEAAVILWLDAFTANIDRTPSNPNLLWWHQNVWCIDHGAALYFHHSWPSKGADVERFVRQPFDSSTHMMRGLAAPMGPVHERCSALLTPSVIDSVVDEVPETWLENAPGLDGAEAVRTAYVEHLTARLARPDAWLPKDAR